MAAKSKNKYDVYMWIKDKVIPSCKNNKQCDSVHNLIYNFEKTHNDRELTKKLTKELTSQLNWTIII